jgi:Mrp family chromosome partitioning ATPase
MADAGPAVRSTPRTQVDKTELMHQRNDIEVDIKSGNSSIASIQSKINQLRGSVSSTAATEAVVESFKKEAELANKEYLEAKAKYNDATDMNSSSVGNYKQITLGQPAIEPEPSKRKLVVAMAGAAAAITTMLILIFLVYLDSSVKTPLIFAKAVNLKLISMVNFMNLSQKKLEDIVANKDGSDDPADKKRHNVFRESIRKLRYEIESSGKKTFLFTSTKKGQGKTTLIQALSYSMSLSKKKILIIDTNFCNNDLTLMMNADPILEKISPGKMPDARALLGHVKSVSKDAGVGTVFVIGSEGGDYTPSEILPRENLLHHLTALTVEFDYIFLEGPPLNDFSDSKELAEYVDGVIAVFSATDIIKQNDKESIAFFKGLNGKFCGSILNKVELDNVNVA